MPLVTAIITLIALIIIVVHFLIAYTILRVRVLREKYFYWQLLNLNIAYILNGVSLSLVNHLSIFVKVASATFIYSVMAQIGLSIERSIMIIKPYFYSTMPLYLRILLVALAPLCFLADMIKELSELYELERKGSTFSVVSVFMILVLFTSNFFVYRVVCKQTTKIATTQVDIDTTERRNRSREIRKFYACFGCVISTAILLFPFCFYQLLVVVNLISKSEKILF